MIDDMASLKQAMEQMDTDDAAVANAARDRAAQILSDARLSFAKIAELIEERRLLLRPKIVASIKRMDQPDGLGEAAFRDTSASLRKEGQSFRQIAEALEVRGEIVPRHEAPGHSRPHGLEFESERDVPQSPSPSTRGVPYPLWFLLIALFAIVAFYTLRDLTGASWHFPGYRAGVGAARQGADTAASSASSSVRPPGEAAAPPSPPASPSAGPNAPSAPPTATAAPSANAPLSTFAANDHPRTVQPRTFNDLMPDRIRRKSRFAGPCMGGVGGCYWGGGQY